VLALLGTPIQMSAPSPLTKTRAYEAFLRPPAALWNGAWGTVDAYRYRTEHTDSIAAWPNPTDAQTQDFGVVDTSMSTVSIAEPDEGRLIVAPDNFALQMDGVDDNVNSPQPAGAAAGLNGLAAFTVEAWVKHDPTKPNSGIFAKTVASVPDTQFCLMFDGGNLKLRVKRAIAGTLQDLSVAAAPYENAPHHIAGSYDGQVMRLYVDGLQVATFDMGAPTAIATGVGACAIGSAFSAGYNFKGLIDEVRVWSVARAAGEIADNMYLRLTGKERNLVGYWPLDEGAGPTATDKSPTASNGTLFNGPIWTAGVPMDARQEFFKLQAKLRDQLVDMELVTRITREDGTTVELINERRCTVKKVARKPGVLAIDVADVDRSALDALFPSKTYTVADWPELYQDHVNRVVPQGMGTVEKVPLTWLTKSGGTWKYGACEIPAGYGTPTVLAVYRDKKFVSAVEYTTATQVVSGVTHFQLVFVKEQLDDSGNVYTMEADILYPGSRLASDELLRLLLISGGTVDVPSFNTAADNCRKYGLYVDPPYSTQSTLLKCIQDLLLVCRGQLFKTPAGAWRIFMDVPRDVALAASARNDEIWVDELSYPEVPKTVTLQYRMSSNDKGDLELIGKLSRTTSGTGKEEVVVCPAIRDHVVADRVACYLTKRRQNRADAKGYVLGQQLEVGDLVALEAPNAWSDRKVLSAPSVQRTPDRNDLVMSEYVEDTYVYTAGALPADATNGYKPDYSQTLPGGPANMTITQNMTFETRYKWDPAVDAGNRALLYIVEDDTGTGFSEVFRGTVTSCIRQGLPQTGSVTARVKAVVVEDPTLASGYATSAPFTLGTKVNDNYVQPTGISGPSIANGSINQGRLNTTTGSGSGSLAAGSKVVITYSSQYVMAWFPSASPFQDFTLISPDATNSIGLWNQAAGAQNYSYGWRAVN
jgi:hypothetical protein